MKTLTKAKKKVHVSVRSRNGTREQLAKIAIQYRIPKAVTQAIRQPDGRCHPVCPRCKITVEREYMHFCDRCGQKLGWRNYKAALILSADGITEK